jgi:hypothetical protein
MRAPSIFRNLTLFAAVALAFTVALAGGPLMLFNPATKTPYAWPNGQAPVYTDLGDLGQLTNAQADAMVAFSVDQWNAVPTSSFTGTVAGDFASIGLPDIDAGNIASVLGPYNGGGVQVVYDADGSIFEALFGSPYFVLGVTVVEWVGDQSPAILESTMILNGFSVPGPPTDPDTASQMYAGVMTHEFGHAINLAHTQTNGQILFYYDPWTGPADCATPYPGFPSNEDIDTMYPFTNIYGTGISESTVDVLDDRAALSDIYPGPGWPNAYPSIKGTIYKAVKAKNKSTEPFTGSNVIARNVANPWKDAISAISGDYSQGLAGPDGSYAFHGLTPGASYVVYVDGILRGAFSTPVPTVLPGPEEYWNGANESWDATKDDRCAWQTITPAAGHPATADIVFNRVKDGPEFIPIDLPNSGISELSGKGDVAVGFSDYGTFRWTPKSLDIIGDYNRAPSSGISRDGKTIVSSILNADGYEVAAMWQGGTNWLPLGSVPGSAPCDQYLSSAWGVSDNKTAVGLDWLGCIDVTGFKWTQRDGMSALGAPGTSSRADKISADASTIVGWDSGDAGFWRGAIWRGSEESIVGQEPALCCDWDPSCAVDVVGEANAVNKNGSIVIGDNYSIPRVYVDPDTGDQFPYCDSGAWRWTPRLGRAELIGEYQPGTGLTTHAFDLSDDGDVIVGRADSFDFGAAVPLLWTEPTGWTDFQAFLADQGTYASDWLLFTVGTVSSDGKTIGGWAFTPFSRQGWLVQIPKVVMCHQPSASYLASHHDKKKTIVVAFPEGMESHLAHGDVVGLCGEGM